MVSLFASFEFRRWVIACGLTVLLVSLQVIHAARATDGGASMVGAEGRKTAAAPAMTAALLVEVSGAVVAAGDGLLGVHEANAAAPVSFLLSSQTLLTRDGNAVAVDDLRVGDRVRMTVDGRTGRVLQLRADAAGAGWTERLDTLGPIAALAWIITVGILVARYWASHRLVRRPLLVDAPVASLQTALTRFGRGQLAPSRREDRPCRA